MRKKRMASENNEGLPSVLDMIEEDPYGSDIVWQPEFIGGILRLVRSDRGLSIMEMERASAVGHSEIHKVETGQQECRVETLVRLCAALGVTVGWVLDRAQRNNDGLFIRQVRADPSFEAFLKSAKLRVAPELAALSFQGAAMLAALLLRSSDPVSRIKDVFFPHPYWKNQFEPFASKLAAMPNSVDRADILRALLLNPVRELLHQGVLDADIKEASATMFDRKKCDVSWNLLYYHPSHLTAASLP